MVHANSEICSAPHGDRWYCWLALIHSVLFSPALDVKMLCVVNDDWSSMIDLNVLFMTVELWIHKGRGKQEEGSK